MPYEVESLAKGYQVGNSKFLSKWDATQACNWYNKAEYWRTDRELDETFSDLSEHQKVMIEGMIRSHRVFPTSAGYYDCPGKGRLPVVMIGSDLRALDSLGYDVLHIGNKMKCVFTWHND
jgi:hypothetical protein